MMSSANRAGFVVGDLGIGIGHGEHHRPRSQRGDHRRREGAFLGQAQQAVRAFDRIGQRSHRSFLGEAFLVGIHPLLAAFVDNTLGVDQGNILPLHAHADIMLGASNARSSRTVDYHLDLVKAFAGQLHSIGQRRAGDDGGAVLVIVEDGNFHRLLQGFLNVEAFRRLNVFQVDAAEGRLQQLAGFDDLVGILGVELDVKYVDVGEPLEQDAFAFHDRLSGQCSDIAQAEHGGSIRDHGNQVAFGRVLISVLRILLNLKTGIGYAGCVGKT